VEVVEQVTLLALRAGGKAVASCWEKGVSRSEGSTQQQVERCRSKQQNFTLPIFLLRWRRRLQRLGLQ
jgi:hypothetical protein